MAKTTLPATPFPEAELTREELLRLNLALLRQAAALARSAFYYQQQALGVPDKHSGLKERIRAL